MAPEISFFQLFSALSLEQSLTQQVQDTLVIGAEINRDARTMAVTIKGSPLPQDVTSRLEGAISVAYQLEGVSITYTEPEEASTVPQSTPEPVADLNS